MTSNRHDPASILQVLDACCGSFTFPMLDNGYVYLAASRLSLHRSEDDWALVIEVFGFSPRSGLPDVHVHTFGSRLHNRDKGDDYVSPEAHQAYLANNPNNASRFFHPIEEGDWIDEVEPETVSLSGTVTLRGTVLSLPSPDEYTSAGIELQGDRPAIFELCRFLAHHHRDQVLATFSERRASVPPELTEILILEDWHHPDVCSEQLPSETETFRELAKVLASGDVSLFKTAEPHNTHWRHWPGGGTL
ncbi:MAG TPA: hypothetical protein VN673_07245 [Clostridia bacterium]|nr:hypothetical protein [Clostridia bacterium]